MVGIGPLRLSCGVWFGRKIGDLMRAFGQVKSDLLKKIQKYMQNIK